MGVGSGFGVWDLGCGFWVSMCRDFAGQKVRESGGFGFAEFRFGFSGFFWGFRQDPESRRTGLSHGMRGGLNHETSLLNNMSNMEKALLHLPVLLLLTEELRE